MDLAGHEVLCGFGHTCAVLLGDVHCMRDLLRLQCANADPMTPQTAATEMTASLYASTSSMLKHLATSLSASVASVVASTQLKLPVDNWRDLISLLWQELNVPLTACKNADSAHNAELRVEAHRKAAMQAFFGGRCAGGGVPAVGASAWKRFQSVPHYVRQETQPSETPPPPKPTPTICIEGVLPSPPCTPEVKREAPPRKEAQLHQPKDKTKEALLRRWRRSGLHIPRCAMLSPGIGVGAGGGAGTPSLLSGPVCRSASPSPTPPPMMGVPSPMLSEPSRQEEVASLASSMHSDTRNSSISHVPEEKAEEVVVMPTVEVTVNTRVQHYRAKRAAAYRIMSLQEKECFVQFVSTELHLHLRNVLNNMRRVAHIASRRALYRKSGEWVDTLRGQLTHLINQSYITRAAIHQERWDNLTKVSFLDVGRFAQC